MSNTMLAAAQRNTEPYPLSMDDERASICIAPAPPRRKIRKKQSLFGSDWMTVAVLLVCMVTICTIGVVYVAAFARVAWQAQQERQLDADLASASAHHEALLKELAQLQSDHRIGPLAAKISMTQPSAPPYIAVIPLATHSSGQREVASAL